MKLENAQRGQLNNQEVKQNANKYKSGVFRIEFPNADGEPDVPFWKM